jgi:hypothetical protein
MDAECEKAGLNVKKQDMQQLFPHVSAAAI